MLLSPDITAIVPFFIGAAIVFVWHLTVMRSTDRSAAVTQRELATAQERIASLTNAALSLETQLRGERVRNEDLSQRLMVAEKAASEAQMALTKERESFDKERSGIAETTRTTFAELARTVLNDSTAQLLSLAQAKFGEQRAGIEGELKEKVSEIKGVVSPVGIALESFKKAVEELTKTSATDLGSLKESLTHVQQLQTQLKIAVDTTNQATGQLRTALTNPQSAGRWGEIMLDRLVEAAGMLDHVHFELQQGHESSEGSREIPDMTVYLTGGLQIPVDAKSSTKRYIEAVECSNDDERARLLHASALDIRSRVRELALRGYDKTAGYAGMTFMFVPNEAMVSSALGQIPDLIDEALQKNIVICSPLLLLCYLKAFASGWRIQQQQENAEEVAKRGKALMVRLQSFFASLNGIGKALNTTVNKYNDAAAKVDRLLVPGRELARLLGEKAQFQAVSSIDHVARDISHAAVGDGECGEPDLTALVTPEVPLNSPE